MNRIFSFSITNYYRLMNPGFEIFIREPWMSFGIDLIPEFLSLDSNSWIRDLHSKIDIPECGTYIPESCFECVYSIPESWLECVYSISKSWSLNVTFPSLNVTFPSLNVTFLSPNVTFPSLNAAFPSLNVTFRSLNLVAECGSFRNHNPWMSDFHSLLLIPECGWTLNDLDPCIQNY